MSEPTVTKQCTKCKQIKPLIKFHKAKKAKQGVQSFCKQCNKDYQREYMKEYHKTDNGREITKRYNRSEKGLEASRQAYKKNRIKKIGSACVRGKVKRGMIPHPSTLKCFKCENQATQYHHHKGYGKEGRYKVVPVCDMCHSLIHRSKLLG